MGKVVIGVKVDCGAENRESAGLDSNEVANLVFSFKFPGMTKHYVAKIQAKGAKLNTNGQGDNPQEILKKLKDQIEADAKAGKFPGKYLSKIKFEHKQIRKQRPKEGSGPGRATGGGRSGVLGQPGAARQPGDTPHETTIDYLGRLVIEDVEDVDLGSDNSKVDLTPFGVGKECGVTTSPPDGGSKYGTGEGTPDPLEPGGLFDDPEDPEVRPDEEEKKRREEAAKAEEERRRKLLERRRAALEMHRRRNRNRAKKKPPPEFTPEPWEGDTPYEGPLPGPHPNLPKDHGPWEPVGIIVLFLEPEYSDLDNPGMEQVLVPFAYNYDSPTAQILEMAMRLIAAGVEIDFEGQWLMFREYYGTRVAGFKLMSALEVGGEAGPFPWHVTLRVDNSEDPPTTEWASPVADATMLEKPGAAFAGEPSVDELEWDRAEPVVTAGVAEELASDG